jgi:hypothetical protein
MLFTMLPTIAMIAASKRRTAAIRTAQGKDGDIGDVPVRARSSRHFAENHPDPKDQEHQGTYDPERKDVV